jgi:transposase InsO family protein
MFIGKANYFLRHINNLSILLKPLENLLIDYKKNSVKLVEWTPEADEAYDTVLQAIKDCPMLYFLDESAPIYLNTDACDYGVGGYLYQVINEVEHPIAFVSKALSGPQLKWSTYDKEAYAIYYSILKLQHYIRNTRFTVKTDHKNLTYIGEGGSPKVWRWREFLLPFNFLVEHIPGEDNIPADALSRLCSLNYQQVNITDNNTEISYPSVASMLANMSSCNLNTLSDRQLHKLKIPENIFQRLREIHNSVTGHFGVDITYQRLIANLAAGPNLEKYPWDANQPVNVTDPINREYVRKFVKNCCLCQKLSQWNIPVVTPPFVVSSNKPMAQLNIDSIGPLPSSIEGYQHILVLIDSFTRYTTLWPIKTVNATEAAENLLKHVGMFGCPSQILSDNGTQFANETVSELLKLLNIEQKFTIAYSKQENAIVERANKEVLRHLRGFIFDNQIIDSWSTYLPLVQRILNSKVHTSTGVSPCQLVTPGLDLNNQIIPSEYDMDADQDMSEFSLALINKQKKAIEIATKHLADHELSHVVLPPKPITQFPINSYVLLKYPEDESGRRRAPNKLLTPLEGPFRVSKFIGMKYELTDLVTNQIKRNIHVTRLVPYNHSDTRMLSPREAANRGSLSADVDDILRHKGFDRKKPNIVRKLQFLVKWSDGTRDKWLPWSELRTNQVLHRYLISHNLKHLVPAAFRHLYSCFS